MNEEEIEKSGVIMLNGHTLDDDLTLDELLGITINTMGALQHAVDTFEDSVTLTKFTEAVMMLTQLTLGLIMDRDNDTLKLSDFLYDKGEPEIILADTSIHGAH